MIERGFLLDRDDINHVFLPIFPIFEPNSPAGGIGFDVIRIIKIRSDGDGSAILGTNRIGMLTIIPGDKIPSQILGPVLEDVDDHPNQGCKGETGEDAGDCIGSCVFGSS